MRNRVLLIVVVIISLILIIIGILALREIMHKKTKLTLPPLPSITPSTITPTSVPVTTSMPTNKVFFNDAMTGTKIWRVSNTQGMTTHAYYDISPWSPDNSKIVWSQETTSFSEGDTYVTDVASGETRWVVQGAASGIEMVADPIWVSDTEIYFVGGTRSNRNVYAVDLSVGSTRQVTNHSGIVLLIGIHLNADRTKMAYFYRVEFGGPFQFAIATVDGRLLREILQNPDGESNVFHPKWSPTDPDALIYANQGEGKKIWLMNTRDFSSKSLTTASDHLMWCPDGTCIVFNDYVRSQSNRNSRVHMINIDGSNKRMVADGGINTFHAHPSFSPDGSTIVIDPRFDKEWNHHILLIDVKTGTIEPLVSNAWAGAMPNRQQLHAHPVWSKDGSMILYAALDNKESANSDVYIAFVK